MFVVDNDQSISDLAGGHTPPSCPGFFFVLSTVVVLEKTNQPLELSACYGGSTNPLESRV